MTHLSDVADRIPYPKKLKKPQPRIHVLIGPPGSGKSTWRKKHLETLYQEETTGFLSRLPPVVISTDDIIEAYAAESMRGISYHDAWELYQGDAENIAAARLGDALKYRQDVIVDQTNLTQGARRRALARVPEKERPYWRIAVVFNVDPYELARRLTEREALTGKYVPTSTLVEMLESYVPPTLDEGFNEIIEVT